MGYMEHWQPGMTVGDAKRRAAATAAMVRRTGGMVLHRDVQPGSTCGGQVATYTARQVFGVDYWCVYCGAKFDKAENRAAESEGA